MALTPTQATTIATRLQQQAGAQGLAVDKYIFSMSMIPIEKRQQLYSQYQEAVKMIQPVPGVTTSIDTSRASIASELPRATGAERFMPIVSRARTGAGGETALQPGADETTPSEVKITDRSWVTLPATSTELQTIETAKAKGLCIGAMKSYYTVKTYQVALKGGGVIYVEALGKTEAEKKAKNAGYKVAYISSRSSTWTPTANGTPTGGAMPQGGVIKVKDGETGEILKFPTTTWDAWPDEYKALVKTEGLDAALKEFKHDYRECADGQFILRSEFNALPTHYADIAATQGFAAMKAAFEAEHTKLGDGQWLAVEDWNMLVENDKTQGTNFTEIGKTQGYTAMVAAIDQANEPYEEFLKKVESGDIIPVAGGEYITKEEFGRLPSGSQQILQEQGFQALTEATTILYEKGPKPKEPLLGGGGRYERRLAVWESMPQTITQEEMDKIPFFEKDVYHLSEGSFGRAARLVLSSFMPPAKALLPEYTTADITAFDWGIAAAQAPLIVLGFTPAAISGSVVGRTLTVAGSTALSGMIGYGTAKSWSALSPGERAMGVGMAALCAVPLITTVARNVKISGPIIPTREGNIVAWKGLSVAGTPIIGKSGGKWVLGTRGITLPEARLILDGYKPEMMLETKVFVNEPSLQKAGFTRPQIDYLMKTLKDRNLFAGKSSPWLDKDVLIEPTERLNANEISTVMQRLVKLEEGFIKKSKIKDAFLLYGSPTIKSQLAPELRNWRGVHDWDISLNMNQAQTEAFAQALLKDLKANGGGTYRISPNTPTLIEKKIGGSWEHIADIHSQEAVITSAADLPVSKLDATGDYSYGRMVSEPAITVKYPGMGELRIMRLSESGVRKADTILRVRQTGEATAFSPPERGIAQPGVPKDAADFYVTLRTLKGEAIAEEWLESWAKAMGYSKTQLAEVLPKIRQSMLDVAANSPSDIIGYEFKPASSARVASGASPSIIVHIPSSLGASVSPGLERQISEPLYPYNLSKSPQMQASISAGLSAMLSKAPSKGLASPKISPSVARSIAASASPKRSPSPAVSKVPSPSPKPSASPVPSIAPSSKPSRSDKPSKAPSAIPSPKPSPIPSPIPTPSPKPSPYPYPYPKPGPKPKPIPRLSMPSGSKQRKIREGPALAVWKQGAYWVSIFPPFRTTGRKEDVVYSRTKPPWGSVIARGRHAPKRTLRSMGHVPELITVPMGVVTARIRNGRHLSFSRSNGRKRGRIIK